MFHTLYNFCTLRFPATGFVLISVADVETANISICILKIYISQYSTPVIQFILNV
jgi:hypothetical protein